MLSPLDDLMVHQTVRSIEYPALSDLRFFDRFIFHVHDRVGEFSMFTGLGCYPNMRSMDAFACAVMADDPHQHNARFFRELNFDRTDLTVGPIHFDILEPMRRWRMRLEPNDFGISFEVEMQARYAPWECPNTLSHEPALVFNNSHFVQSAKYEGTATIAGRTFDLDGLFGVRDRSWGVRQLAGFPSPGNVFTPRELLLWFNPQFEDSAFLIRYHEDAEGKVLVLDGGIMGGQRDGRRWVSLRHDFEFREGIRLFNRCQVVLVDDFGEEHVLKVRPAKTPTMFLEGAGYGRTQGRFLGNHAEGELWPVANGTLEQLASYGADNGAEQFSFFETNHGDRGTGIAEYSIKPTHRKYPGRFETPFSH